MKKAPKTGDRSLEGLPSSPIEKQTILALLLALDTKSNTIREMRTVYEALGLE